MKKLMYGMSLILFLCLAGCAGEWEIADFTTEELESRSESESEGKSESELETEPETVSESDLLKEWTGYYLCWGELSTGTQVSMDFWIYEEDCQYYGYLLLNCWEKEGEAAYKRQINGFLTEIHGEGDSVEACFLKEIPGETEQESRFTSYEEGEKLFVLRGGREAVQTEWLALEMSESDRGNFMQWDKVVSAVMVNEEQVEAFLRAEGISADEEPWFCFDNDLKFWFDSEKEKGVGLSFYPDHSYIAGFTMNSEDIVRQVWEDRTYSVTKAGEEDYMPDAAEEAWEYNEAGQPVHYLLKGSDPWGVLSDQLKIIEITYTYREDGTLAEKACFYNHRAFGTTRMSETSVYDSSGRILYTRSYVTHGGLEDYYIYEGDAVEPSYCLIVDHQGPAACVDCFVEYVEDSGE